MRTVIYAAVVLAWALNPALAMTLELQAKITLPGGKGRIDHLAFDADQGRVFVAELGNGTVAVVDIGQRRLLRRLEGLSEPQGIAYYPPLHRIYVADGGNGTVRAYDARDFRQTGSTRLVGDADNIRIDPVAKRVYVGHGEGGLAVLDPDSLGRLGDIPLQGHPESFQLSPFDGSIYVNVPDAKQVAVVERHAARQVASWPTNGSANFPMAIDEQHRSVLSVFRRPARIVAYSSKDGAVVAEGEVCGDADDLFVDAKRKRVYVICGEGAIAVLEAATLRRIETFATTPGARTGLYSVEADLLLVAARAGRAQDAAVWVLKPID